MSFIIYDIVLLSIFLLLIGIFLYRGKKNIRKDGILLLYKTKWGINLIHRIGEKHKKLLHVLSYVSIFVGYALMASILYLFGKIVYIYTALPQIVQAIKIPPILPLFPYLPQAFKLDFLPPFYFTYWIIIIAIIAIPHEFFHGIFAAKDKVKIKKTGFGFFPFFLPVFLAAFVEPEEKQMEKKSKFSQMAVLSAGTFANVLTGILFFIIMVLFFIIAFTPSGVIFDDYAYTIGSISAITMVNNATTINPTYERLIELINISGDNRINIENETYIGLKFIAGNNENIKLYIDAPAANSELKRVIVGINGEKITSTDKLSKELEKYSPGQTITITVPYENKTLHNRQITLGENPNNPGKPWLGIIFVNSQNSGLSGKIISAFSSFKKAHIYYNPLLGDFSLFIYNLLWWIVLISFSVALVNMLPMGIFDGGRFFYLTIWGITKNEKFAAKSFKFMTSFLLFLLLIIMVFWAINIF